MSRRKETGFVTTTSLFAGEFRQGRDYANWRPRGSGDWLLIFTAGGAGLLTTGSRQAATRVGEAILFPAGEVQDYGTDPGTGRWHLLWVHFLPKPEWLPWLKWRRGGHGVPSVQVGKGEPQAKFAAALRRIVQVQRRGFPQATDFARNALEEALLWARLSAEGGRWGRLDERVRKAMDYLAADLRRPFRLEEVARHCGLSVSRLAHLFTEEEGRPPQQFFEELRMVHATELLRRTSLSVKEIAGETGYEDPFYFTNRFRRHAGCSPTEFRKRDGRTK